MVASTSSNSKRRHSKSVNKRFNPLNARPKPDLAVDTSFSRYNARVPEQIFPYESKTQEPGFVSFHRLKAARKSAIGGLKQQLENRAFFRTHVSPKNSHPTSVVSDYPNSEAVDGRSIAHESTQSTTTLSSKPSLLHHRVKGLRPSPLDLTQDVSPSDRAITIGIVVSPEILAKTKKAPHPLSQEASRPTILVTSTKDELSPSLSTGQPAGGYRPPSSVYSRYTNCIPKQGLEEDTPPMPPLPLFLCADGAGATKTINVYSSQEHQINTPSLIPTPRRSRGWWNFITSPFSAKSNAFFWRSPPLPEEHDTFENRAILTDASAMGRSEQRGGFNFFERSTEDDVLRSAPPSESELWVVPTRRRSQTAPGALKNPETSAIDIYRIPSQGAAAAYYDPKRHFPSLIFPTDEKKFIDWSPSTVAPGIDRDFPLSHNGATPESQALSTPASAKALANITSPFADVHRVDGYHPSGAGTTIFTTPSESDFNDTSFRHAPPYRKSVQAVVESHFSPISPSPIIGHAHVATLMGPQSTNGEPREVDMPPSRSMTPASRFQPETSRGITEDNPYVLPPMPEKAYYRPAHSRSSSYGLGITDGPYDLFPPPRPMSEKPRLTTDRWGQLQVADQPEEDHDERPWFRQWFWVILTSVVFILIFAIVGLTTFLSVKYNDEVVEAHWKNTTGFPALPEGVLTVARPTPVAQISGCVSPESLWSCAVPKEQQESIQPNAPDQPNFRFEIRFRNSSDFPANETTLARRSLGGPTVKAHAMVKRNMFTKLGFTPNPALPPDSDLEFLGQTTDNVTSQDGTLDAGEKTPFFITFEDPQKLGSKSSKSIQKREDDINPYPYPLPENVSINAPSKIPGIQTQKNGSPMPATLYPYVTSQQLRLYNRGRKDEHYGFYAYFDRSIFIANLSASSADKTSPFGQNVTSNVALKDAKAVCTWSQTRFHVQIWTQKAPATSLMKRDILGGTKAENSTANVMTLPGSFPYATTITLDRHGGVADKKGVYCYDLTTGSHVNRDLSVWVPENRAFGGQLVNPAQVPGGSGNATLHKRDSVTGGIDGGTGGCSCQWQNWK